MWFVQVHKGGPCAMPRRPLKLSIKPFPQACSRHAGTAGDPAGQLDAILFLECVRGPWLRGREFHHAERPKDLPVEAAEANDPKRDPDNGWL